MTSSLQILLLDDDSRDAELIQELLEAENFVCEFARVQTSAEFLTALEDNELDLILADYKLPSFDGISALKLASSARPDLPFIFVSGTLGEELAIEALKMGATDYILKTGLSRLASSVRRAMRETGERAERKEAEEALRRSEAFLAEAQRLSHTGSFGWNASSGEVYWSHETCRIFGYESATKPTVQMVIDRTHPDDRMHVQQIIDRATMERIDFTAEHRLLMPDGSVRYVRAVARPSIGEDPQSLVYVGAVVDITEHKHVEEALRQREKELREVVDTIPAMTVMALPDGSTVFASRRWTEYSGLSIEDSFGLAWKATVHPADLDRHMRKRRESWAIGEPFESEVRLRRAIDGEYRWFLVRWVPLRDEGGDILRWYGILADIDDRKRAEAEVREREAKIRRLVDANIIGIFIWDLEGEIVEANDAFLRIVGYGREDLVAGRLRRIELTPLEWRERTAQARAELTMTGTTQPYEKEYFRKDGSRVPILFGAATFEEGANQGVAFVLDLTERKRAEAALRESEEQWKAVFENNPTMYFMVDPTGIILSVNPFGAEQLGYSPKELIGRPVEILIHEADREQALRNKALCEERPGRTLSWELRKIRKDGEILWARETARAMLIKNKPVVLIACEDITEAKRTEYFIAQVFHRSPDGVSIVGRDYHYQRVNPIYERNWDMPADRIVGKHVAELLGAAVFEQTVKPYLDRCFEGEEVSFADWFTNSAGRSYLAVTYSPLRPRSERVDAALVITRDLTDHLRASEVLRETQTQLAHANRVATMGQLTASIAHEVNQPIAATVTNAQAGLRWLGADPPNLDEARQALDRIVRDGARAGAVVGRIRNLVKKAPPSEERVDIYAAIREVIELTRSEAMRNGVSVQTDLALGLPPVRGDRVELQQVILNLILNALEAMSETREGLRELLIGAGTTGSSEVLVSVRDSGPGLAPAMIENLFKAFHTTKPNGLGLGLSICRSIIESHGGRLWAGANAPRGAVFQFTLPAHPDIASRL